MSEHTAENTEIQSELQGKQQQHKRVQEQTIVETAQSTVHNSEAMKQPDQEHKQQQSPQKHQQEKQQAEQAVNYHQNKEKPPSNIPTVHKSSSEAEELKAEEHKTPTKVAIEETLAQLAELPQSEDRKVEDDMPPMVVIQLQPKTKEVQQSNPLLEPVQITPPTQIIVEPLPIHQILPSAPTVRAEEETQQVAHDDIQVKPTFESLETPLQQKVQRAQSVDPPTLQARKLSHSASMGMNGWAVQVKHVNKEDQIREGPVPVRKQEQGSSESDVGDESQLDKQIAENQMEQYAYRDEQILPKQDESNESEVDETQDKARLQEVMRLAEESKNRLTKELEMSEKLRKEMDEEIPFTKKIFASAVVATIVGGAAVALTKNKRKSVVASLAALALSFIIQ